MSGAPWLRIATQARRTRHERQPRPRRRRGHRARPGSISRSAAARRGCISSKTSTCNIGRGEAIGMVGPSGLGQVDAADGHGRARAADTGSVDGRRRRPRRARRGRARALSRPQCRHRVPVLPSDPDHDGAGERRGAARACRATPMRTRAPRRSWHAVGLSERGSTTIRRNCPAASSSASRSPARWRPIRRS